LIAALDDEAEVVRAEAALALAEVGPGDGVDRLLALARPGEGKVAQAAVVALGESNDPRVVPLLRDATESADGDVRFQAVLALARVAPESAETLATLTKAAQDSDAEVRANVAAALADLALPQGRPLLETLLGDSHQAVRLEAALALAELGARAATQPLLAALADADVAPQAVRALGQLRDPEAAPALQQLCRRWTAAAPLKAAAAAALAALDDPLGWAELKGWLSSSRREARGMAVYACGEHRLHQAVPLLKPLLANERLPDREAVAQALGRIGSEEALEALAAATDDADPDVAAEAQAALEQGK
jgi:HEAT repeat protein